MYTVIRLKKVMEKTGLAKSTIYKKIREREFPTQISLGGKAVGWLKRDVDAWIEQKIMKSANDNSIINPASRITQVWNIVQLTPANDNKIQLQ